MALYFDAAAILSSSSSSPGSLRSCVYDSKNPLRSSPPLVYGLITECAKWDVVLSEIIENADIVSQEPRVCHSCIRFTIALLTDTEPHWLVDTASCRPPYP
jgi:hypothetical protein